MHPAKSVILFTTASGAGYGLIIVAAIAAAMGHFPDDPMVTSMAFGLALLLIVTGLLASTFHLGHPERAWRALTQWKTSWLSREGVVALWTFVPILAWAALRLTPGELPFERAEAFVSAVAAASALLTLYCTGMIYASLKAVPDWSTRLTPLGYILLGAATGAVLFNAVSHALQFQHQDIGSIASVALLAGLVVKLAYWKRMEKRAAVSTSATATGLDKSADSDEEEGGAAEVDLLEAPHTESNYLMQEMGFRIARKHAAKLRRIATVWTFIFPMFAIWFAGYGSGWWETMLITISVLTCGVGIVAERYLFFAEAKHVQSLYYGEKSV